MIGSYYLGFFVIEVSQIHVWNAIIWKVHRFIVDRRLMCLGVWVVREHQWTIWVGLGMVNRLVVRVGISSRQQVWVKALCDWCTGWYAVKHQGQWCWLTDCAKGVLAAPLTQWGGELLKWEGWVNSPGTLYLNTSPYSSSATSHYSYVPSRDPWVGWV